MSGRLRAALNRLWAFWRKQSLDGELDAEMTAHLEFAIEENLRRGLSAEEARREALVKFGGMEQAKEQHREVRGLPAVDVLMQDLRFTFRTMRRDRSFTVIALLILGLGIGANVAVFSVVNTILLRPLPFSDPQQLVWIEGPPREGGLSSVTYSVDGFEAYQQRNHALGSVTAYMPFYGPSDYKLTGAANRLWPGQDPLGRVAVVGGQDATVVGVVSDVRETSVEDSSGPEVYLSIAQAGPVGAELVVRTKLPPDVLASSVMRTLRELNPGQPASEFRPIRQIVDHAISPRRFFVLLVSGFAALGLVLAALGIYGVISYSVARRTQEIGIRMALGATAAKVQLSVIQGTLRLALLGIALGTAASFVVARGIASLLFGTEPTDPATFAGMILLLASIVLVAGYIPARRASRTDPMIALRSN